MSAADRLLGPPGDMAGGADQTPSEEIAQKHSCGGTGRWLLSGLLDAVNMVDPLPMPGYSNDSGAPYVLSEDGSRMYMESPNGETWVSMDALQAEMPGNVKNSLHLTSTQKDNYIFPAVPAGQLHPLRDSHGGSLDHGQLGKGDHSRGVMIRHIFGEGLIPTLNSADRPNRSIRVTPSPKATNSHNGDSGLFGKRK